MTRKCRLWLPLWISCLEFMLFSCYMPFNEAVESFQPMDLLSAWHGQCWRYKSVKGSARTQNSFAHTDLAGRKGRATEKGPPESLRHFSTPTKASKIPKTISRQEYKRQSVPSKLLFPAIYVFSPFQQILIFLKQLSSAQDCTHYLLLKSNPYLPSLVGLHASDL